MKPDMKSNVKSNVKSDHFSEMKDCYVMLMQCAANPQLGVSPGEIEANMWQLNMTMQKLEKLVHCVDGMKEDKSAMAHLDSMKKVVGKIKSTLQVNESSRTMMTDCVNVMQDLTSKYEMQMKKDPKHCVQESVHHDKGKQSPSSKWH